MEKNLAVGRKAILVGLTAMLVLATAFSNTGCANKENGQAEKKSEGEWIQVGYKNYDKDGQLTEENKRTITNGLVSKEETSTYEYGECVSVETKEYEYDENGSEPVKVTITDSDGTRVQDNNNAYDEAGNLLYQEYFLDGVFVRTEYEYENGVKTYGATAHDGAIIAEYLYNEHGDQTEIAIYFGNDEDLIIRRTYKNNYDDNGRLTDRYTYQKDGSLDRHENYLYDENGNLIRRDSSEGDYIEYEWEYYTKE